MDDEQCVNHHLLLMDATFSFSSHCCCCCTVAGRWADELTHLAMKAGMKRAIQLTLPESDRLYWAMHIHAPIGIPGKVHARCRPSDSLLVSIGLKAFPLRPAGRVPQEDGNGQQQNQHSPGVVGLNEVEPHMAHVAQCQQKKGFDC